MIRWTMVVPECQTKELVEASWALPETVLSGSVTASNQYSTLQMNMTVSSPQPLLQGSKSDLLVVTVVQPP